MNEHNSLLYRKAGCAEAQDETNIRRYDDFATFGGGSVDSRNGFFVKSAGFFAAAASIIVIFQFSTGSQSLPEFINPNGIQLGQKQPHNEADFKRKSKTISRSAISDYKTFITIEPSRGSNSPVIALASRITGFWRDKKALVLLKCLQKSCEETQLMKTEVGEDFLNAGVDQKIENIIAFTGIRVVYLDLKNNVYTEAAYSSSCNWMANSWEEQPTIREFEAISIFDINGDLNLNFTFSGWTCVSFALGDQKINLRPPVGFEVNHFKSYRINAIIDQLGTVHLRRSVALNP